MDAVDLAILQEMTSEKAMLFSGLNPRVSPEDMARRLGLDPTTIRARIRRWEEAGFLRGFHVLPNPSVLGLRHCAAYARVPDTAARGRFFEDLGLVDGVVTSLEHVHGTTGVGLFVEGDAALARRVELLRRLPGVQEVMPPFQPLAPHDAGRMTPLDWRALAALRAQPRAKLAELAGAVGVSVNTMSARVHDLVARGAMWCVASLDFTRFTGGVFVRGFVELEGTLSPARLAESVTMSVRPLAFVRPVGGPGGPGGQGQGRRTAHLMLLLESVAQVDDLEAALRALDGVRGVRLMFPREYRVHPRWMEERVREAVERAQAARRQEA